MNLATLIPRHARHRPDHTAYVFRGERIDFRELDRRVGRLSRSLAAAGIARGDRLATFLPNCLELLDVYWAAARLGAVAVPLSPLLRGPGLSNLLEDSGARVLVTDSKGADVVDAVRDRLSTVEFFLLVGEEQRRGFSGYSSFVHRGGLPALRPVAITGSDPYNIVYSSGTTGQPKGIVLSHDVRTAYATHFASAYRMTPESVVLHSGSLVFNGAFLTLMPAAFLGATFVLQPGFDAEAVIDAVQREGVTHMLVVPSQLIALLASPRFSEGSLASLEMLCSLGAPLHREHKEELNRRLEGRFYELYGLTEGFVTVLDKNDYQRKPDSVGVPPPFFEMRIVGDEGQDLGPGEVGEIVGRGPILMEGYHRRDDLTREAIRDGWLYSGDLGSVDEDGYLYLVDRKKDLILSGGVNVYPRDIEEVIARHPAVQEAAVFAAPSDKWGETAVAAVVLRPGTETDAEELRGWTNERVDSRYQKVADVVLLAELPRNVAGKTLKRTLREDYVASSQRKLS